MTAIVIAVAFFVTLDLTVVNVALPAIQTALAASSADLTWVVEAFVASLTALLPLGGSLGDRLGRKWLLLVGGAVFIAGSVLAVMFRDLHMLVVARGVMGVGAALALPQTLSLILAHVRGGKPQTRALNAWSQAASATAAIGPLAGGLLLQHGPHVLVGHETWAWCLGVPGAGVALALIGVLMWVPGRQQKQVHSGIDPVGQLLFAGGLGGVVWGLVSAPDRGWTAPAVLAAIGGGAAALLLFGLWEKRLERRGKRPMLPLSAFTPAFWAALGLIGAIMGTLAGVLFVVQPYFQYVLGWSPIHAGLALLPVAAGAVVSTPLAAKAIDGWLSRQLAVTLGASIIAVALVGLAHMGLNTPFAPIGAGLFAIGIGIGFGLSLLTKALAGVVREGHEWVAAAGNELVRELFAAVVVAVMSSVDNQVLRHRLAGTGVTSVAAALTRAKAVGAHQGQVFLLRAGEAYVAGMDDCLKWIGACLVGGAACAAWIWFRDAGPEQIPTDVPYLRGWLHALSAPAAIPVAIWLIGVPHRWPDKVAAGVFGLLLVALFANSARYHRWPYKGRRRDQELRGMDLLTLRLLAASIITIYVMDWHALQGTLRGVVLTLVWVVSGLNAAWAWHSARRTVNRRATRAVLYSSVGLWVLIAPAPIAVALQEGGSLGVGIAGTLVLLLQALTTYAAVGPTPFEVVGLVSPADGGSLEARHHAFFKRGLWSAHEAFHVSLQIAFAAQIWCFYSMLLRM